MTSVHDLFLQAVDRGPRGRTFIHYQSQEWSYEDVLGSLTGLADTLNEFGIGKGDRVLTLLPQTPQTVIILLALSGSGAAIVPLVPESSNEELEYFLNDSQCTKAIFSLDAWSRVADAPSAQDLELILLSQQPLYRDKSDGLLEPDGNQFAIAPAESERVAVDSSAMQSVSLTDFVIADTSSHISRRETWPGPSANQGGDEFAVLYTSGTTGRAKGVMLDHESFVMSGKIHAEAREYDAGDVVLCVMPLHHSGGLYMCLAPAIASGAGLMIQDRFSVSRFWRDVHQSGATGGLLMDTMIAMLLAQSPSDLESGHQLRFVIGQSVWPEAERRFGFRMGSLWAMTETATIGTFKFPDNPKQTNREVVGRPAHKDVEIEIRDESGHSVSPGTVGEICCKHPWIFGGYLNKPDFTSEVLRDGWVYSGDLGWIDKDGDLHFVGRKKHMIKRSGENISAREVEDVLLEHSKIDQVAVFGVPDPIRMEEVKAVIVPKGADGIDEQEVVAWCKEKLASFKVPRFIEVMDDMPMTHSHKPNIEVLRNAHGKRPSWDREEELPQ